MHYHRKHVITIKTRLQTFNHELLTPNSNLVYWLNVNPLIPHNDKLSFDFDDWSKHYERIIFRSVVLATNYQSFIKWSIPHKKFKIQAIVQSSRRIGRQFIMKKQK